MVEWDRSVEISIRTRAVILVSISTDELEEMRELARAIDQQRGDRLANWASALFGAAASALVGLVTQIPAPSLIVIVPLGCTAVCCGIIAAVLHSLSLTGRDGHVSPRELLLQKMERLGRTGRPQTPQGEAEAQTAAAKDGLGADAGDARGLGQPGHPEAAV